MFLVYFLIGFIATVVGSMAGLGGGVIIKPVLDALGHYDLATISVLSSFTVFSMAIVSTYKQFRNGVKFKGKTTLIISFGSILGGILGKSLFSNFLFVLQNESLAKTIQAVILALLMIFVFIYINLKEKLPKFDIHNSFFIFFIGFLLGTIASFLGIGGGPINVAILAIFFSMDTKEAAIHSILIILFSQASKLLTITFTTGFSFYNLEMLCFMVPGGIIGGLLGAKLNKKIDNKDILKVFNITLIVIILLNIWNSYVGFMSSF
ncbi:sulfite exporter TauE/SafE family protein [Clostridium sp. DL1XJH146]